MNGFSLFVFFIFGVCVSNSLPRPSNCGTNSSISDHYPWIVYLEFYQYGEKITSYPAYITKGFLIDKDTLLTSASNVDISPYYRFERVFFGEYAHMNANQTEIKYADRRYVLEITKHEEADIAVVRFAPPIEFTDNIKPICLPDRIEDISHFRFYNYMCTKYSHLFDTSTHPSGHATRTRTSIRRWAKQDCDAYYYVLGAFLFPWQECFSETRQNTCSGDLGGPLMYVYGGYHFAAGVASKAVAIYEVPHNSPTIYVNLMDNNAKLLDWVRNVTETKNKFHS